MSSPSALFPTQLTFQKNPADPISYASAWLALVPQGLVVVYVTLMWASREAEIILMFAGQMACELLNFSLKRLIREERPERMRPCST
jgi:dolichyldiphosphatase